MWSPADLFTPGFNAVTLSLKRVVTYFAEHLMVLAFVIVGSAVLIAAVTAIRDRREKRS